VKGSQLLEPLFEYSGACAGCGETPYVKLLTQLFGDRMMIANATGCSSIYGGNLPTTPYTVNERDGRGPAWSNSLFEDNAEFGFGMRLAVDKQRERAALELVEELRGSQIGDELVGGAARGRPEHERGLGSSASASRRCAASSGRSTTPRRPARAARRLPRPKSVWIVGGDGWAYDIGYGGLDHVLGIRARTSTCSCSTPRCTPTPAARRPRRRRSARREVRRGGKPIDKKDLGLMAMPTATSTSRASRWAPRTRRRSRRCSRRSRTRAVARHRLQPLHRARLRPAVRASGDQQKRAVTAGIWPLYRYDPKLGHFLEHGTESYAEALSYFPDHGEYEHGPDEYLDLIRGAKESLSVPVVGSLNGVSKGGWVSFAKKIEEAGADALELNVYYVPTDPRLTSETVENVYLAILSEVKSRVGIPVNMKIGPFFSSFANFAKRLEDAGADGISLFNRFYVPDLDLEELEVAPRLELSTPFEIFQPLRWIGVLRGQLELTLAATSGVHTAEDALKLVMAGADVVHVCGSILKHGPSRITEIRHGLATWLEEHDYESLDQARGSLSQRTCPEPAAFERANYMKVIHRYS
jgi:dihydroorotate dehydrogenase (fumarate)